MFLDRAIPQTPHRARFALVRICARFALVSLFWICFLAALTVLGSSQPAAADGPKGPEVVTAGSGPYSGPTPAELAKTAGAPEADAPAASPGKTPEISTATPGAVVMTAAELAKVIPGSDDAAKAPMSPDAAGLADAVGHPQNGAALADAAAQPQTSLTAAELEKLAESLRAPEPVFRKEAEAPPPPKGAPQELTPEEAAKFGFGTAATEQSSQEVKP
jgi:hypothetical protein